MDIGRLSWIAAVVGFTIAAVAVFAGGYVGYAIVLLAVAASAAVNLR
jgi:hypothetical protein